jgi:hypothetical protein
MQSVGRDLLFGLLLIFLNGLRYAGRVPWQALVVGSFLNIAIIAATAIAMRRVYQRLRGRAEEG